MRKERDETRQRQDEEIANLKIAPKDAFSDDVKELLACFDGRKINWTAAKLKGFQGIKIIKYKTATCGDVNYMVYALINAEKRKCHHCAWKICDVKQTVDLLTASEYKILFLKLLKLYR